jgi:transcriptional regulator with XRE-family HTH domain
MRKIDYFPLECKEVIDLIAFSVKNKRLASRVRQADLAEQVGVSVSTIRNIEAGERGVELGTVLHVLWQLGILRDVLARDRLLPPATATPARRVRLPSASKEDF